MAHPGRLAADGRVRAEEPEDRDLVISVLERLDPEQADAFLASVMEDLAAGAT